MRGILIATFASVMALTVIHNSAEAAALDDVSVEKAGTCFTGDAISLHNKNTHNSIAVTIKWGADVEKIDWLDADNSTAIDTFPRDYTIAVSPGEVKQIGCTKLNHWPHSFTFDKAGADYVKAVPQPPPPLGEAKTFIRQWHIAQTPFMCWAVNLNPDRPIEGSYRPVSQGASLSTTRLEPFRAKLIQCFDGNGAAFTEAHFVGRAKHLVRTGKSHP
ncbi:MAG: hypothetical protein J0I19_16530 [Alphaproteobacteria bacterium]|nr:hypothetical protein [Alphaproteobacteria bacterium]